jgi:hypothetical protein
MEVSRNFGQILQFRNDRVLACFADASVGTVPISTAEFEWKKLVSIQDGLKLETAIELVPNLSEP